MTDTPLDPRLVEADRLMKFADGLDAHADDLRGEAMELRQAARRIRGRVNRERDPRFDGTFGSLLAGTRDSNPRTPAKPDTPVAFVYRGVNYGVQARRNPSCTCDLSDARSYADANSHGFTCKVRESGTTTGRLDASRPNLSGELVPIPDECMADLLRPNTINGDAVTIAGGPSGFGPSAEQLRDVDPVAIRPESDWNHSNPRDARETRCAEIHSILGLRCLLDSGHRGRHRVVGRKSGQSYSWFSEDD
jgi:hypothetical protein